MKSKKNILIFFISVFFVCWIFALALTYYLGNFNLFSATIIALCGSIGASATALICEKIAGK